MLDNISHAIRISHATVIRDTYSTYSLHKKLTKCQLQNSTGMSYHIETISTLPFSQYVLHTKWTIQTPDHGSDSCTKDWSSKNTYRVHQKPMNVHHTIRIKIFKTKNRFHQNVHSIQENID